MKLAIIGSRSVTDINLAEYIPNGVTEIVSGGAMGVDSLAREYARDKGIKLTEFLPDYRRYGRGAPLKRNESIADYADKALAFWNGSSKGTSYTVKLFRSLGKRVTLVTLC